MKVFTPFREKVKRLTEGKKPRETRGNVLSSKQSVAKKRKEESGRSPFARKLAWPDTPVRTGQGDKRKGKQPGSSHR